MIKMIVVCAGDATASFDREYYNTQHLALAMECWGKYGLEEVEAFYPVGQGDGWISIGVYRFRNQAAMDAALSSPETERVMADVRHFTDTKNVQRSVFSPL